MGNNVKMIGMMEALKARRVPLVFVKVCESYEFHLLQVSFRSQRDAGPEWIQLVIQSQESKVAVASISIVSALDTAPPQCSRTLTQFK